MQVSLCCHSDPHISFISAFWKLFWSFIFTLDFISCSCVPWGWVHRSFLFRLSYLLSCEHESLTVLCYLLLSWYHSNVVFCYVVQVQVFHNLHCNFLTHGEFRRISECSKHFSVYYFVVDFQFNNVNIRDLVIRMWLV